MYQYQELTPFPFSAFSPDPDVVQTFDLRTPRLLGVFTFKVPSSESPARTEPTAASALG